MNLTDYRDITALLQRHGFRFSKSMGQNFLTAAWVPQQIAAESGITGILCYSEDLFLQALEGGRDEVCELYNTIVRDDRHTNVRILTYEEISERRFGNWTMGHVDIATVNPSLLLKYAKLPVLNPFNCSGHASMALLEELLATASVIGRSG